MAEDCSSGVAMICANDQETKQAYLSLLAVRPDARGRGIARELVDACVENARQSGMMCIQLLTLESNIKAMGLYARAGCKKVGSIEMKAVLEKDPSMPSL